MSVKSGVEEAMSTTEFVALFGGILSNVPLWKLKSVLKHMEEHCAVRFGTKTKGGKKRRGRSGKSSMQRSSAIAAAALSPSQTVRRMRRKDYMKYLKSPLWKEIRNRVLVRDDSKCACCGKPAENVHHRAYTEDVLAGENDSLLISLCEGCHLNIHFEGDEKFGTARVEQRLKQMLADRKVCS